MLDWLFRKGDEAAAEDASEADALPAWLGANEMRRDWDVLGETSRGVYPHDGPTELPAWRQSEAQLDALLSASFWELERNEAAGRQPTDLRRDSRVEKDARVGRRHESPSHDAGDQARG